MKCIIKTVSWALTIIGSLNLGVMGFFHGKNILESMLGKDSTGLMVVYDLIGIAGVLSLICMIRMCCGCCSKCKGKCDSKCHCNCHKK